MGKDKASLISDLPGKLGKAFSDNIGSQEEVLVKLSPSSGEAIVVTSRRVLIIKAGNVTGAGFFGARAKSFSFQDIASVDLRVGVMGGHIQIAAAGTVEHAEGGIMNMVAAENAITFASGYKDTMRTVADLIRQKVEEAKRPAPAVAATSTVDLTAELERLGGLHAKGFITDVEFTAAKKKLLGL